MNPHDEQARELLKAARRDMLTFRILLAAVEAPVESLLFHAQQAIEKAIKAVLVVRGVIFPRTHDLVALHDLGGSHALSIPVSRELLARLAPYAVEFRYLGVVAPVVSPDEAALAVGAAVAWAEEAVQ